MDDECGNTDKFEGFYLVCQLTRIYTEDKAISQSITKQKTGLDAEICSHCRRLPHASVIERILQALCRTPVHTTIVASYFKRLRLSVESFFYF